MKESSDIVLYDLDDLDYYRSTCGKTHAYVMCWVLDYSEYAYVLSVMTH